MANFNFNKVILGGRLTADPELKTTPSGVSVTTFTMAVNRRFGGKEGEQPQADFINVTAWRQTAEFITRFFRKASSICIVGSVQTRSWTDGQGQKRFATEVVADEAYFVDAKGEMPSAVQSGHGAPAGQAPAAPMPSAGYMPDAYAVKDAPRFEDVLDDEALPF